MFNGEVNFKKFHCESVLTFFVNGKKIEDSAIDPEWTLLFYLRNKLRLCGTKLGCGEGGCGACTVMVSKYDRKNKKIIHLPVNACLTPVCAMHGLAVTTVEGIGSTKTKLHAVQERIAKAHGSQCGFCTPGMVMSMYVLLRQNPTPKIDDMEEAFQGNLCRCTGYRPIIEGFKTFIEDWEAKRNLNMVVNGGSMTSGCGGGGGGGGEGKVCGMGDKCCRAQNGSTNKPDEVVKQNGTNGIKPENSENDERLFKPNEFAPYHPTQERIFPPELKLCDKYDTDCLVIRGSQVTWYRPTVFQDLLDLKHEFPHAKIVVGNTEVGVETKFKKMLYPVLIMPNAIEELNKIEETNEGVKIGASVTLQEIREYFKYQVISKKHPEEKTRIFKVISEMLFWFAGKQIRSVGAIGGNIMTGSPISDMLPILMAIRAKLDVYHKQNGSRTVLLDHNFFTGYRKTIIQPDEVLVSVHIPFSQRNEYMVAYKQARRREDDIAIVNAAVNVVFEENTSNIISRINFGFGGMSFKTITAPKTEANLKGKPWNRETLQQSYNWLLEDCPLDPSAPGGMIRYRKCLVLSLFTKAFISISQQRGIDNIDLREVSGAEGLPEFDQKSSQYFTIVPDSQEKHDAVHRPIVHTSAFKQATGEAVYSDDIPRFENELHLAFVTSTRSYATILSIDESEAVRMKGVHGFVSAKDISKELNIWGSVVYDEQIFRDDRVTSQGQIIGAIVADDQTIAQRAVRQVKIDYEDLQPVIVSIEDAIRHRSFFSVQGPHQIIKRGGDVEEVFKQAPHILEGQCRMGGQEHFYFETQGVVVVPKHEDDEYEIFSSTQNPSEVQHLVAHALGIHQNKIILRVKRCGGGFGGKETKAAAVALPVAVAAKKFNRPIRCMLDRDEDMVMTGGRHPCLMRYKVAFESNGKILACDAELYINGGYSVDLSMGVCERAITHFENAYYIPRVKVSGWICKTNLSSNTAFRGFGGPQGMYVAESMVQDIADYLGIEQMAVSEINLYKTGDLTPYNQVLENCTLDKCWRQCVTTSNYWNRKKFIEKFNKENRYRKRGMSVIPTKFGIAFGAAFLNQAGALVNIYLDGSVLVHHSGIEIGQGLYTKVLQVASRALGIPIEQIHTSSTSTDIVPNTSATAASTGSDLNGMAVLNACNILNERLAPYKKSNPNGTWKEWIKSAYMDRVSLSTTGFYKIPNLGHNWETNEGNLYAYFTYGVACSEVEIDTLTGDHKVVRTDIVMDIGESINPAIDVGQIEGAFMQGYGLFVLEELVYSPTGVLFTRGPGTYKIPGFGDIPAEFNVSILKGASNPRAVYSSKAVGEPPLFLASSILFAIKNAVKASRVENGIFDTFKIDAPATAAKIRMAMVDEITAKIEEPKPGSYKPWNVVA